MSYLHLKQTFLKYFFIYLKQKSLKKSFIYLSKKVLGMTVSQKTSVSLYLWDYLEFYMLYIFFYTQLAFVFHAQEDFYVIRNHILAFYLFRRKILYLSPDFFLFVCFFLFFFFVFFFEVFLCFFIISGRQIFRHFYI